MKNMYINSRLRPLLVGTTRRGGARKWIFSQGEPWLFLTPGILHRLADRLGLKDRRVSRLVGLIRRHCRRPQEYCRRLGMGECRYYHPGEYPPVLCPRCDGVFYPHPEDVDALCPDCQAGMLLIERRGPTSGEEADRMADQAARERLMYVDPSIFHQGQLSPNYKSNLSRRLHRDWDTATNRILMGGTYRRVAEEFDCSVGLLHRKVRERTWENN